VVLCLCAIASNTMQTSRDQKFCTNPAVIGISLGGAPPPAPQSVRIGTSEIKERHDFWPHVVL
jgi:hypothetical protein